MLRFIKKKSDDTLKELVSEYLNQFKQDSNGLLADIWLSMCAVKCVYGVYFTIRRHNFMLHLKFAASLESHIRCLIRMTKASEELNAISDLLIGCALHWRL